MLVRSVDVLKTRLVVRIVPCTRSMSSEEAAKQVFPRNGTRTTRSSFARMSKLFRPVNVLPPVPPSKQAPNVKAVGEKDAISKSQRLMLDNGLIHMSSVTGALHLLPIAFKSLEKLTRIIDTVMSKINCQKLKMPILASTELWKVTGRLDDFGSELINVRDRQQHDLLLCPTHEEVICDLIGAQALSHRNLPLRLYQITEKFRDELRPRFGLLRGREFIMKDLYTFDADESSALQTYEEVNSAYAELFNLLGVKWVKAQGSTGLIGGSLSHEFHLISDVGEDTVIVCNDCKAAANEEVLKIKLNASNLPVEKCPNCDSQNLVKSNAIEVGHSFFLGTKYSKPFHCVFGGGDAGKLATLQMGCYGIGVSRLLGAVIEVLSTNDEIRWPLSLAPYLVCIIPPKEGSKEEQCLEPQTMIKVQSYMLEQLPKEILLDDRTDLTIGRRLKDIKKLGIPYVIVFGKQLKDTPPKVEFVDINNNNVELLEFRHLFEHLYNLKSEWTKFVQ